MSYYFNTKQGLLIDSTDNVPNDDDVEELDELEYAVMSLRMKYSSARIIIALELSESLYIQVGK